MTGEERITAERFNHERTKLMSGVRKHGASFAVEFHGRPFAAVLPFDQLEAERAERDELRKRVAELEAQLRALGGAA